MYLLPSGQSSAGFTTVNPKWGGASAIDACDAAPRVKRQRRRMGLGDYISVSRWGAVAGTPAVQANQPSGPAPQNIPPGAQVTAAPSQNPLDYVSPQAAVAAGLDPQTSYTAWTTALAQKIASGQIVSQQDAIQQGFPPGLITQMWSAAVAASPAFVKPASWLDQSTFGIKNSVLIAGGIGLGALALLVKEA